jgi:hypothetical protein
MRMQMRRLIRLTNAFSKKADNLWEALCLHLARYNLAEFTKPCACLRRWKLKLPITYGKLRNSWRKRWF